MGAKLVMRSQVTPVGLAVAAVAVAAIVAGVMMLIGSADAGRHGVRLAGPTTVPNVERLSVLTHAPTPRSAAAYAEARSLPADAVRAETIGSAEVYVFEDQSQEICLTILEGGLDGNTCGRDYEVPEHGLLAVMVASHYVRVGVLAPNGVRRVTLIDHDGARHQIAVTNNVAVAYDSHVATVRYALPDGGWQVEKVPAAELKPLRTVGQR